MTTTVIARKTRMAPVGSRLLNRMATTSGPDILRLREMTKAELDAALTKRVERAKRTPGTPAETVFAELSEEYGIHV